MKPKFQRKGGGNATQSRDQLHQFMVSVQNFVKSEGHDEEEARDHVEMTRTKRISRKEMRKEKRKLKKKKKKGGMKAKQPGEERKASGDEDAAPQKAPSALINKTSGAEAELKEQEKKPKRKVHFEKTSPQPEKKAKVQTMRKKALLEANEVEDREIKKLEKRLGLHKRKNKKSLPQSFISDGLDYILGILEPGGTGLYHSDEEEESAAAKGLQELEEDEDADESQHTDDEVVGEDEEDADEDEDLESEHAGDGGEEEEGEDEDEEEREEEDEDEEREEVEDEDEALEEEEDEQDDDVEENSQYKSSVSQYRLRLMLI